MITNVIFIVSFSVLCHLCSVTSLTMETSLDSKLIAAISPPIIILNPCANVDCGPGFICTSNGGKPECVDRPPKSGECPAVLDRESGDCISDCNNDYNCHGAFKCCPNGCGYSCQSPYPKPGKCPPPGRLGVCVLACRGDSTCGGDKKCCETACGGRICIYPVDDFHPGTCPALVPGQAGVCAEACQNDSICASDEKCCVTACGGHICQTAVQDPPAPSCDSIICPANQHCVLQPVVCIKAPCNPVPTCVDNTPPLTCADLKCPKGTHCEQKPINYECLLPFCPARPPPKCVPNLDCANIVCPRGQVCVERVVPCFRAPCPVIPQCIKIPPLPPAVCVANCSPGVNA